MSLNKFFNPSAVAVIGASRTPGEIGHTILENLKFSFKEKIYPINPNAGEILGLTTYSSVLDIEEPIDLAIIAVPGELVKDILLECKKKKIESVVIISSGFSEIGENERELELENILKTGKMRVIGPNCIGIYQKCLDMIFFPRNKLKRPPQGSLSFITQSGAFGSILLDTMAYNGIGVSKFISIGNKIDVNETDLIDYLEKDMETRCIAIYLESISDGQKFIKTAKKATKIKPIVAFKAGKTEKGNEAVASHTGSLAGSAEIYSAAFKQAGIIEAKDSQDIFDYAKALANQPVMKDNKIAIITDGGGFGIVATDAAVKNGLEIVDLDDSTKKALKKALPSYGTAKNPVDLTGDADVERYQKSLEAVLKDKNVSGVVIIALMQLPTLTDEIISVIRDCKAVGKPISVCSAGSDYVMARNRKLEMYGVPVYPTPERAVKALKVLHEYGKILKRQ